jgi:hypothetical protein
MNSCVYALTHQATGGSESSSCRPYDCPRVQPLLRLALVASLPVDPSGCTGRSNFQKVHKFMRAQWRGALFARDQLRTTCLGSFKGEGPRWRAL